MAINEITRKHSGQVLILDHQPGNGTSYRVIATKLRPITWLVSVPDFGGCVEVSAGSAVHYGYVQEKVPRRNGRTLSDVDASEIAKAIAKLVPGCTAYGCTDESERLDAFPKRALSTRELLDMQGFRGVK